MRIMQTMRVKLMERSFLCVLGLLGLLLVSSNVAAQNNQTLINHKKARELNREGYRAYLQGSWSLALQKFQLSIKHDPYYSYPVYNSACVLSRRERPEDALQIFRLLMEVLLQETGPNRSVHQAKMQKDPDLAWFRRTEPELFILLNDVVLNYNTQQIYRKLRRRRTWNIAVNRRRGTGFRTNRNNSGSSYRFNDSFNDSDDGFDDGFDDNRDTYNDGFDDGFDNNYGYSNGDSRYYNDGSGNRGNSDDGNWNENSEERSITVTPDDEPLDYPSNSLLEPTNSDSQLQPGRGLFLNKRRDSDLEDPKADSETNLQGNSQENSQSGFQRNSQSNSQSNSQGDSRENSQSNFQNSSQGDSRENSQSSSQSSSQSKSQSSSQGDFNGEGRGTDGSRDLQDASAQDGASGSSGPSQPSGPSGPNGPSGPSSADDPFNQNQNQDDNFNPFSDSDDSNPFGSPKDFPGYDEEGSEQFFPLVPQSLRQKYQDSELTLNLISNQVDSAEEQINRITFKGYRYRWNFQVGRQLFQMSGFFVVRGNVLILETFASSPKELQNLPFDWKAFRSLFFVYQPQSNDFYAINLNGDSIEIY